MTYAEEKAELNRFTTDCAAASKVRTEVVDGVKVIEYGENGAPLAPKQYRQDGGMQR